MSSSLFDFQPKIEGNGTVIERILSSVQDNKDKTHDKKEILSTISQILDSLIQGVSDPKSVANQLNDACRLINKYPETYLDDSSFYFKLTKIINSKNIDPETHATLINVLLYVSTLNEENLIKVIERSTGLQIFQKCLETNSSLFEAGSQFFSCCFDYEKAIQHLFKFNFFGKFIARFNEMLDLMKEENDETYVHAIFKAAELFLQLSRKTQKEFLEPGKEQMHSLIMRLFDCPLHKELIELTSHIVVALGAKFGYEDIKETEMYSRTINILGDPELAHGLKYAIALINNTLCEQTECLTVMDFPLDKIIEIITIISSHDEGNEIANDKDLIRNIFYLLITSSLDGDYVIANYLEAHVYEAIINIIQNEVYSIRMLGIEFLWTILISGTAEQSLFVIENNADLLLEILAGDDESLTARIMNLNVGPFIERITRNNPEPFTDFVSQLKEAVRELLDNDSSELAEVSERLDKFISESFPE